jgi:hypothetical protein
MLFLIAAAAVAAIALVLAIVFLTGGDGEDERATLEAAGCTLQVVPGVVGDHTAALSATSNPKWNTNPPTSGPHNDAPAVWSFYDEPVPLAQTVHNLEHGGIVIHYGPDVPAAEVEKIRSFYTDDPNGIVVAPLRTLGDTIALAAWTAPDAAGGGNVDSGEGFLAKCSRFHEGAFSAFVDEHRYKGPERFPPESLTPGS